MNEHAPSPRLTITPVAPQSFRSAFPFLPAAALRTPQPRPLVQQTRPAHSSFVTQIQATIAGICRSPYGERTPPQPNAVPQNGVCRMDCSPPNRFPENSLMRWQNKRDLKNPTRYSRLLQGFGSGFDPRDMKNLHNLSGESKWAAPERRGQQSQDVTLDHLASENPSTSSLCPL